jgi:5-methylcytosine-specific restriction endonuclease McrA
VNDASWQATKRAVYEQAGGCCEYCRSCDKNTSQIMEVEHIDPNGGDLPGNLCLSCGNCNRSKGIATSAVDPETMHEVILFNPRAQHWTEHFTWAENATVIVGITAVGRATMERLKMNRDIVREARRRWVIAGFHPPKER